MSQAVIEIVDNGKGMSKEEINNIFTPGFTTSAHGSGLGLVIAKNIIQSHNGTIKVHSVENSGTAIEIRLPLTEQDEN
jgi:two-component system, sporulation sensor kinase D